MSDCYLDKWSCLTRARNLLASGDEAALRYACLEFRYCMEAITYDKLDVYRKRLPYEVMSKWQPPQLMHALVDLEDGAEDDYTLAVARESSPGVRSGPFQAIGHHRSLKVKWLAKAYHTLGSLLHLPRPDDAHRYYKYGDPAKLRARLNQIAETLEPVVNSTLTSAFAQVVEFQCGLCRRLVVANATAARKRKRAVCLQEDCQAEHDVTEDENKELWFTLNEDHIIECSVCQAKTPFPRRRIKLDAVTPCPKCGQKYVILANYMALPTETEVHANE